jgi:hypothetical protein
MVYCNSTYGIEVMYEGQEWIVDQIQKVNVKIAKDIAGLKSDCGM